MTTHDGRTRIPTQHVLIRAKAQIVPVVKSATEVLKDKANDIGQKLEALLDAVLGASIHAGKMMKIPQFSTYTEAVESIVEWIKNNVSRNFIGDLLDSVTIGIRPLLGTTKFKSTVLQLT